jgi:predicted DCC family thiol-disulfide oxidoreductase YuxK
VEYWALFAMQPGQTIGSSYERPLTGLRVASMREIFGIDLRTLALFRIGLATLLLVDLAFRARDLTAHYTDMGILPRSLAVGFLSPGSFSLHLLNGTVWFQAGLFIIAALFAAMLLVGFRTRLVTIVSWVLLLSLQNRNPQILSGDDNLLVLMAFWAMFLPLGARFSVDSALDRRTAPVPNAFYSMATIALLVQGMSMYFFGALLKSDAQWVPEGTALYYALQPDYFATPLAIWFREFPDLLENLTYYIWTLELLGPVLIFLPIFHRTFRLAMLVAFSTMHLGLFLVLEIGLFPFVAILMNLTFLSGWIWDGLARKAQPVPHDLRIYYDEGCAFCHKVCRLLTTFLILPKVPIQPAQTDPKAAVLLAINNSWVVSDGEEADYLEWDAVRHLVACSPLFWPLAKLLTLKPLKQLGDWFYLFVARNRPVLGEITAVAMPWRPAPVKTARFSSGVAGFFLAFVIFQNLTTLPGFPLRMSDGLAAFRQTMGLYQNWSMFAPHPEMTSAWPVILGELKDGSVVDVYNRKPGIPTWNKPEIVSAVYDNYRWRNYLSILEDVSYEQGANHLAQNYAGYLCRSWNADAAPGKELSVFNIYFNVEWSLPDYEPKEVRNRLVWSHDCFG